MMWNILTRMKKRCFLKLSWNNWTLQNSHIDPINNRLIYCENKYSTNTNLNLQFEFRSENLFLKMNVSNCFCYYLSECHPNRRTHMETGSLQGASRGTTSSAKVWCKQPPPPWFSSQFFKVPRLRFLPAYLDTMMMLRKKLNVSRCCDCCALESRVRGERGGGGVRPRYCSMCLQYWQTSRLRALRTLLEVPPPTRQRI